MHSNFYTYIEDRIEILSLSQRERFLCNSLRISIFYIRKYSMHGSLFVTIANDLQLPLLAIYHLTVGKDFFSYYFSDLAIKKRNENYVCCR